MKTLLEKIRQFNKRNGKKGSALVTVIYITSIALVLVMSIFSLTSYSLNNSIVAVKEDQALINAQSIAKMISDDLTSKDKVNYMPILEALEPNADGTINESEIVYELNNEELGDTTVSFKNEKNRINNVVMTVSTNYKGETGVVKVRFKVNPDGEEKKVALTEITKIFENTVYSGAFPSGLIGSLNFVDFAGDIVIKLDKASDVGKQEEGIFFGGKKDGLSRKEHHGNLIVIFNDPTKTLYLGGGCVIDGHVITDGNISISTVSKIGGSLIAKGDVAVGATSGNGSFDTVGANLSEGDMAVLCGGKLTLVMAAPEKFDSVTEGEIDSIIKKVDKFFKETVGLGLFNGSIYAEKGVEYTNHILVNGKFCIGKDAVFGNKEEPGLQVQGRGVFVMAKYKIPIFNTIVKYPKQYKDFNDLETDGYLVRDYKFDGNKTIKQRTDEIFEKFYTSTPNPLWYAPDDYGASRSDIQYNGKEKGYWHNFTGKYKNTEGEMVSYESRIKELYKGISFASQAPITNIDYDWSKLVEVTTPEGNPEQKEETNSQVKVISGSGYINQDVVDKAKNPIAVKESFEQGLLSDYNETMIIDTRIPDNTNDILTAETKTKRSKSIHLKLTSNILFDNTDVIILGDGYVYFYVEQYRIEIGSHEKDNGYNNVSLELDSYIHFGVKYGEWTKSWMEKEYFWGGTKDVEKQKIITSRIYNIERKDKEYFTIKYPKRPQVFLTSSYGDSDSKVIEQGGIKKKDSSSNIYPFVCVNNNACIYSYLFAPYRTIVLSESYWDGKNLTSIKKMDNDNEKSIYKFMGSLCVSAIDDYAKPYTKQDQEKDYYKHGVGLFRVEEYVPYKKMHYFNPAESRNAFDRIYFNRESIPVGNKDNNILPPDMNQEASRVDAGWSIEAFL